jgi:hypothetical protein
VNFTLNLAYSHINTYLLPFFFKIFLRIEVACISFGRLVIKRELVLALSIME